MSELQKKIQYQTKINDAIKLYHSKKYLEIFEQAQFLLNHNNFKSVDIVLAKLPTKEQLLTKLIESLAGKSIYKTLKAVNDGKEKHSLKAVTSLATHIAIEIEKGNLEYKCLLPNIMEKINQEIYKLLNG